MNAQVDIVKSDADGDIFCQKYQGYVTHAGIVNNTLRQLEKNYERAFGEIPSREGLAEAIEFVQSFLFEIGETAKGTAYAHSVSRLIHIFDDSPLDVAANIHALKKVDG